MAVIFFPLYTVITRGGPTVNHWKMKRVRTTAEKERDALNKRNRRAAKELVSVDVTPDHREFINLVRAELDYPDQRTVIGDGVALLQCWRSKTVPLEKKDEAKPNYIGTKENLLTLLEGSPCRECCKPLMIKSTSNLGTSLSVVYTCENGHEKEWNSSKPNKERTHCEVDFDLCAASIMAKSTAAKAAGHTGHRRLQVDVVDGLQRCTKQVE